MLEERTERPEVDDSVRLLFVYGILRPDYGSYLHSAIIHHEPATAHGRMWDHGYPVVKFDEVRIGHDPRFVYGDLLWLRADDPAVAAADRMEIGAGYEVRKVTVEVISERQEQDLAGENIECDAYHYLYDPRGRRIWHGDYIRHMRETGRL